MDCLLLIRHSLPEITADVPATQWVLSETGRKRCKPLAERLAAYAPAVVVTSTEQKANQTGEAVARMLGVPLAVAAGLHEHVREGGDWVSREDFEARLGRFFAQPSQLVFGCETAGQALRRFSGAVEGVLAQYPSGTVAVVAHGTVMALWVASLTGVSPMEFWKRLGMPALVVLSRPDLSLMEVVEHVE